MSRLTRLLIALPWFLLSCCSLTLCLGGTIDRIDRDVTSSNSADSYWTSPSDSGGWWDSGGWDSGGWDSGGWDSGGWDSGGWDSGGWDSGGSDSGSW